MPEVVNTSFLGSSIEEVESSSEEVMIKVDRVSMVFNMANETMNNLKEYAIALARRELRFKEFRALDDISIEVRKGDVFGILGTNGSGKSTLLKIIAGVLEPSEGTCTINGNIAPLIELGAGFDMELTARENIYLNGALLGYSKSFIEDHFDEIVEFAEIEKFLDMPLKNYSSGMVARIAFAIATVIVPDILIVDEVLSVGDFMFQQKCERRIQTLIKEHQVTVLIVSHDNNQVERLCNKAVWIEKGHVRIDGTAQDVCQVYRVLGGHIGSAESEERIFELLRDPSIPCDELVETFAGETRYATPVNLLESLEGGERSGSIILAPGENHAVCMLANAYSSLNEMPVLLTRPDRLPDIVDQKIRQMQISSITVLGGSDLISDAVVKRLEVISPAATITRIDQNSEERLAYALFKHGESEWWGRKAILTYQEGIGDILCFMPYSYRNRMPLFFSVSRGVIGEDVLKSLVSGSFDEVLLLGGEDVFPAECLAPFEKAGIPITRFCGKDPFDANNIITSWVEARDNTTDQSFEAFFVSIWNPSDALAMGPLTKQRNATVLVEDAQNLDSITNNFSYIEAKKDTLSKVVFFGDSTQFSDLDKMLLLKDLQRSLRS